MLNHKGEEEIRTNRLSDAMEMFKNYANDDRVTKYLCGTYSDALAYGMLNEKKYWKGIVYEMQVAVI